MIGKFTKYGCGTPSKWPINHGLSMGVIRSPLNQVLAWSSNQSTTKMEDPCGWWNQDQVPVTQVTVGLSGWISPNLSGFVRFMVPTVGKLRVVHHPTVGSTLQGINISHQQGRGKSSTQNAMFGAEMLVPWRVYDAYPPLVLSDGLVVEKREQSSRAPEIFGAKKNMTKSWREKHHLR